MYINTVTELTLFMLPACIFLGLPLTVSVVTQAKKKLMSKE